jgi:hypothetical protein
MPTLSHRSESFLAIFDSLAITPFALVPECGQLMRSLRPGDRLRLREHLAGIEEIVVINSFQNS